ncbi:NAD(P)/FAD-dependent oxidoreductase [Methylocapsa sp. S129]|uniref:flavin-containing monooxygenase n=1 Tax=Methylocapsa sp. S129 TaxID=1641869 RepID=UPI001AEE3D28|nr:FAD-dependent oxidoreductase [Methylocapsa sp. S129]
MDASLDPIRMPERAIAVIGGGPAGLVTARYLKKHGFEPIVFEASNRIGGQWNAASPTSAVWPGMRTNTSRILSAFSDLDHAPGVSVYPTDADMLAYLERYAQASGLGAGIRLSTRVESVERGPGSGWIVRSRHGDESVLEHYNRVVVASGRNQSPEMPDIPGMTTFAGSGGFIHSARYGGAEPYRGKSVLVAGCSISALEIASELAFAGAAKVTLAMRRQRYVLQKLLAGVPTDHVAFTRFAAVAGQTLPPEAIAAGMKAMVVSRCGSPEQFGAPKPDDNIFAAGLTQSQNYLALVAEGRIQPRPWIAAVDGRTVRFADGASEEFDALILGAGFRLSLPFLSDAISQILDLDGVHIDLFDHTLHPDLDGLAFIGAYQLIGPNFPVFELQARWLTYMWAGLRPLPPAQTMRQGLAMARTRRAGPPEVPMHALATIFASNAGVEPDPASWPELERALWFGPLSPISFRLTGPDALADAPARTAEAARAFGAIATTTFTADETARLEAVLRAPNAKVA